MCGVDGFGPQMSYGLARCGFGDQLLRAYEENSPYFHEFLVQWRNEINRELATNSRQLLPRGHAHVPTDFPDLKILKYYADPVRWNDRRAMRDKGELNLDLLAKFCEKYFEWGFESSVVKRFRDLLWPSAVMHVLRRAALEADEKEKAKQADPYRPIRRALEPSRADAVGTPASLVQSVLAPPREQSREQLDDRISAAFVNRGPEPVPARRRYDIPDPHPLITKVMGTRHDASTGGLLEYRVEISPVQLVELTRKGLSGKRSEPNPPPKEPKTPPPPPDSMLRLWIPASMLRQVHPGLVEDYLMREEAKKNKTPRARGKRRAATSEEDDETDDDRLRPSSPVDPLRWIPNHPGPGPAEATPRVRFHFTCPNPDEPDFTELKFDSHSDEGLANAIAGRRIQRANASGSQSPAKSQRRGIKRRTDGDDVLDDTPIDDDDAPHPFNDLWDQLLDSPRKKDKSAKKPRASKATKPAAISFPEIHPLDSLLIKLDKVEIRRTAKRQKLAKTPPESSDEALTSALARASASLPELPKLDYPQGSQGSSTSSFSSSRPWETTKPGRKRRAPHYTYYPEASSSQDSRLSWHDDVIDLT
ncbi:hypothetical protein DXG03_003878 [Asterophora parasitica]|uniref:Holliday junction resolvase Gen1 C-terminal domain-containing protein n=1 Tax=Asterophora parasitica TaxID=117018 RepID=A0A9P7GFN7_9AGAR|nr:hypothetical protein DXG03_003878 [Asterophora parasitica]